MSQVFFGTLFNSSLGWFMTLEMLAKWYPFLAIKPFGRKHGFKRDETMPWIVNQAALASKLACPAQMLKSGIKLKSPLVWHGWCVVGVCPGCPGNRIGGWGINGLDR